jgi:cell division GTPase FtsZ
MASTMSGMGKGLKRKTITDRLPTDIIEKSNGENIMSDPENKDDTYINEDFESDDFDFVDAYDDDPADADARLLPANTASSAINCGFVGVGGGGGKLAKAFLDLGFNKTLLVNTTEKDQPDGLDPSHFVLVPGADGVGKDIALGRKVLEEHSALVEDALRSRVGKIDWLFVLAGGGGGTGSASHVLHSTCARYLKSIEASGKVFYIVSKPTAQELLNSTIEENYNELLADIQGEPHIVIDNEKQLQLLRGKVGMLNMFPAANKNFAKLLAQVFKLASEHSPVQTFDSKDLEKCLSTNGRHVIGSTIVRDIDRQDLGATVFQGCLKSSPCPPASGKSGTGVLLLVVTEEMGSDPDVSRRLEAAFSYVGGRTQTLFSGVYVKKSLPGLIAITMLGGEK